MLLFFKWLCEWWFVRFVGMIYFLVYAGIYGMYPHEIATIEALKKRGFIPKENTQIRIDGWKNRNDDYNTFITTDIYNYIMPFALFFSPTEKLIVTLDIYIYTCSTIERNAEEVKQQEIEQKLDILLHSTPSHSELYKSRSDELDSLCSNRKDVYASAILTVPINNSVIEFLINYIVNDPLGSTFFIKNNEKIKKN